MKLINKVITKGDNVSIELSEGMRNFLTALFATNPTKVEMLVVAHLQTVGLRSPWNPGALSKETGVSIKEIENALKSLVEKNVVLIKTFLGTSGVQPEINQKFGQ